MAAPPPRVLVTGAARGLGFAIAAAFHAADAAVAINDRLQAPVAAALARLGGGPRLVAAAADLATAEGPAQAVRQAVEGLGGLDILVNNAAVNVEAPIEATDAAHWDLHLAVCLTAPFLAVQAALPALRESRGLVVTIASELGLQAIPNNVAYVTAKHGVVSLTRCLALDLAPLGIRTVALCPGTMDTELMQDCAQASGDPDAYYAAFRRYHPLGRLAEPAEIAGFVLALAQPAAAFITGAALAIDGGSSIGRGA